MGNHWLVPIGLHDIMGVEVEVDPGVAQVGIVEGVKGVESVGVLLCGAVAPQQLAAEIDSDLWHKGVSTLVMHGCDFDACHKILLAVGAQLPHWKLASGEYDGLGEVLQHVGEG